MVLAAKTTAIVVLLSRGHGIVTLALVTLGAEVLEMAVKSVLAFRSEPTLRFAPSLCDRPHVRALLRYGGLAILVGAAHQLIWRTDALVIGAMISDEAIALFTVGANLAVYARNFVSAAGRVLTPAAAALEAQGGPRRHRRDAHAGQPGLPPARRGDPRVPGRRRGALPRALDGRGLPRRLGDGPRARGARRHRAGGGDAVRGGPRGDRAAEDAGACSRSSRASPTWLSASRSRSRTASWASRSGR